MSATRDLGPVDITDFSVGAMLRAGIGIRAAVRGAESLEEAADRLVRYLHEQCVSQATGERSCALIRFYGTLPFRLLDPSLQAFAQSQLNGLTATPELRCLTLLASSGDEIRWNSRLSSRGHRAIPLPSADAIRGAPMIMRLFESLGLDVERLISGGTPAMRASESRTYEVFHVEQALGSPFIPAQTEFVVPYGIQSVLGFGGMLRNGELFSVILFSRHRIPAASAARFRTIALDARSTLFLFDEASLWRDGARPSAVHVPPDA